MSVQLDTKGDLQTNRRLVTFTSCNCKEQFQIRQFAEQLYGWCDMLKFKAVIASRNNWDVWHSRVVNVMEIQEHKVLKRFSAVGARTCFRSSAAMRYEQSKIIKNSLSFFSSLSSGRASWLPGVSWRILIFRFNLAGALISSCIRIKPWGKQTNWAFYWMVRSPATLFGKPAFSQ